MRQHYSRTYPGLALQPALVNQHWEYEREEVRQGAIRMTVEEKLVEIGRWMAGVDPEDDPSLTLTIGAVASSGHPGSYYAVLHCPLVDKQGYPSGNHVDSAWGATPADALLLLRVPRGQA